MVSVLMSFKGSLIYFSLVFYILGEFLIKQLFHLYLLDMRWLYNVHVVNSALRASLAIFHLISNAHSWNNYC